MFGFDRSLLNVFETTTVRTEDLDRLGQYTRPLLSTSGSNKYGLRNRHAVPARRQLLSTRGRSLGDALRPCYTIDHIGAEAEMLEVGRPAYCLVVALSGAMQAAGAAGTAEAHGSKGMILGGLPGSRVLSSDKSARLIVWVDAARMERVLQAQLREPPRDRLAFAPGLDWNSSQGGVLWRLVVHLLEEANDPAGLLSEGIARETFTDLFMQTLLMRLPNNHTARLERPVDAAVPRHVRRAEAFMDAAADHPITMADIAAAAGCGTSTLYAAFRQFRNTTPHAALHALRLRRVHQALQAADDEVSTRSIARRFGFTNPSRFIAAYGKAFGEHPNKTRRRG